MRKLVKIKISGRVQGVFFRFYAQEVAGRLGIAGLARNEPDGTVYIEAQGEEDALREFLGWCESGPPLAKVEKVESSFEPKTRDYREFKVP